MNIAVPPFPPRLRWLGREPAPVERICARGPLLVHFIDASHLSSVRTLPYLSAWNERYSPHGLTVLGVNSPRFPFTGEEAKLAPILERLAVAFPVALDDDYLAWHDYGCEGWPSLFLWGRGGALRWFHFGEGEYAATEAEIADELRALDPAFEPPPAIEPLRGSDAPGALVVPPSDELFPGGSTTIPWRAGPGVESLDFEYAAGGAHVSVAGSGLLRVALDGGRPHAIEVVAPGLIDLAVHPRHEGHSITLAADPEVEVYSVSFSAGLP
jgi:hypothetical protein